MVDGLIQAVLDLGILKSIGSVTVIALFLYGMLGVKHNKKADSGSNNELTKVNTKGTEE